MVFDAGMEAGAGDGIIGSGSTTVAQPHGSASSPVAQVEEFLEERSTAVAQPHGSATSQVAQEEEFKEECSTTAAQSHGSAIKPG